MIQNRTSGKNRPCSVETIDLFALWKERKRAKACSIIKTVRIVAMALFLIGMMTVRSEGKSAAVQISGDISQLIIPVAAYTSTYILDDDEGRKEFYESCALSLGVTYCLKLSIDKKRPDGGIQAFPSGHTSIAFQGATFIQRRYGWKFGIPSYLAATYVGWSRIDSKKHDLSDVLTGAAIGFASSYLFTKPFKGVTVAPLIDEDAVGLTVNVAW